MEALPYLVGVVASLAFACLLCLVRIEEGLRKIEENTRGGLYEDGDDTACGRGEPML